MRARLEAAEKAAATKIAAAAKRMKLRKRFVTMKKCAIKIQATARMYIVHVLIKELLFDVRMLRTGQVFIKFSNANGRPHDRLVQVSPGMQLKWKDPTGDVVSEVGDGDVGLKLHEIKSVSGSLNFTLLKLIVESLKGFEGKHSGAHGHFALRTKCCLDIAANKRSLGLQAQSEWLKDEWVSALKLMVYFRKELRKRTTTALGTHAQRMALHEALESRRLVREAVQMRKRKKEARGGFFASFRPGKK